jgi:hypothetical protein
MSISQLALVAGIMKLVGKETPTLTVRQTNAIIKAADLIVEELRKPDRDFTPARPMNPDWARFLRDQCRSENVAFFFKQWGEWAPGSPNEPFWGHSGYVRPYPEASYTDGPNAKGPARLEAEGFRFMKRVGKKQAGRTLDGQEWNELPRVGQEVAACSASAD